MNEPPALCYSKKFTQVEPEGCGRTEEARLRVKGYCKPIIYHGEVQPDS